MVKEQIINEIIRKMSGHLNQTQLTILMDTLSLTFKEVEFESNSNSLSTDLLDNKNMINSFCACKRIDGLSQNSEKAYLFTLKSFMEYTNYMSFTKVDTNTVRCYLLNLEQKGCSRTTCDNNRRNLNSFFSWLENENYIKRNPVKKIKKLKEPYRIKRFFSELEIEKLRDSCKNKRELALVDLLLCSGLRVGEVPNIKLSDIDWDNGSFNVIGKGNKERTCYLNVKAKKHIMEYIDERKQKGMVSEYLFCRDRIPRDGKDKPLCKEEIGRILKNIGGRCNVKDIHVHGLRAYFATNLCNKGISATIIQALMGHESYNTTVRYYCKQNKQDAQKAVLFCS